MRNLKTEKTYLENKLKTLETNFVNNPESTGTNEKLDTIYQEKINGIRTRSKCDWYEHGEKSLKFFLKKSCAVQNQIRNILIGNIDINNEKDIYLYEIYLYYKFLFHERQHVSEEDINNFLNAVSKFP